MSTGLKTKLCIRGEGLGLYAGMRTMMALVLAAPLTLIAGCGGSDAQPAGGTASEGERDEGGVWRAERDITLGEHVPGYPSRAG